MHIDLNCDLGEGFPHDAELMALITSANVACGGHAGDAATMRATLELTKRRRVQVGAHPSHPDREHFGRRELERSEQQIALDSLAQVGVLTNLAVQVGTPIRYLKPHGALYNQACSEATVAGAVVRAAGMLSLAVMGLPGSALAVEAKAKGLRFIAEGFADRRYQPDGSLVPRSEPEALIEDAAVAVEQAERLIRERSVETICVHGDNPQAVEFVRRLRKELTSRGFSIRSFTV